jgi:hypothetical protein
MSTNRRKGSIRGYLGEMGMPDGDPQNLPDSRFRFPDGAQFRVEIPSVEGPRCLEAVLAAAESHDVVVHRVSQGSGVSLLLDRELDEMAIAARTAGVEVSLFARPSASWGLSAAARAPLGSLFAGVAYGQEQLVAAMEEIGRAAEHGFRSVLISDLGVLDTFSMMRSHGWLPNDMRAKVSVMLPVSNPMSANVVARLGADTINIATDLTLAQVAAIRTVLSIPLDIYVEAPDNLGGFVRHGEIADIVRVASPVYLKFGLRNAPDLYPSGSHLEDVAVRLSVERVRRARLGLEALSRTMPSAVGSRPWPNDLAVPAPRASH